MVLRPGCGSRFLRRPQTNAWNLLGRIWIAGRGRHGRKNRERLKLRTNRGLVGTRPVLQPSPIDRRDRSPLPGRIRTASPVYQEIVFVGVPLTSESACPTETQPAAAAGRRHGGAKAGARTRPGSNS